MLAAGCLVRSTWKLQSLLDTELSRGVFLLRTPSSHEHALGAAQVSLGKKGQSQPQQPSQPRGPGTNIPNSFPILGKTLQKPQLGITLELWNSRALERAREFFQAK